MLHKISFFIRKYSKELHDFKGWLLFFKIIGIIGILYSLVVWYLILAFRHGIGF